MAPAGICVPHELQKAIGSPPSLDIECNHTRSAERNSGNSQELAESVPRRKRNRSGGLGIVLHSPQNPQGRRSCLRSARPVFVDRNSHSGSGSRGVAKHSWRKIPISLIDLGCTASDRDLRLFLCLAGGSLHELETQAIMAEQFGYLPQAAASRLEAMTVEAGKMLDGLISSLRAKSKTGERSWLEWLATANWRLKTGDSPKLRIPKLPGSAACAWKTRPSTAGPRSGALRSSSPSPVR